MRVEVEFLSEACTELLALLRPGSRSVEDAVRFVIVYVEDAERQLAAFLGEPPGAERQVGADGEEWWWHYVNNVWLGYHITDGRGWPFMRIRTVQVFAARSSRPIAP